MPAKPTPAPMLFLSLSPAPAKRSSNGIGGMAAAAAPPHAKINTPTRVAVGRMKPPEMKGPGTGVPGRYYRRWSGEEKLSIRAYWRLFCRKDEVTGWGCGSTSFDDAQHRAAL